MLRRSLVLLLIPTVLLQGTCLAHSHVGTTVQETPEHAENRHFHLPLFGHAHPHHQDGEHRHHGGDVDQDDDIATERHDDQHSPADDHDDDAVYLPLSMPANASSPSN